VPSLHSKHQLYAVILCSS